MPWDSMIQPCFLSLLSAENDADSGDDDEDGSADLEDEMSSGEEEAGGNKGKKHSNKRKAEPAASSKQVCSCKNVWTRTSEPDYVQKGLV